MSVSEEGLISDLEQAWVMAHTEAPGREAAAAVLAAAEQAGIVAGREYEAYQCGRLALHETAVSSETAEAVTYVTAADFVSHEEAKGIATRAWNVLTREHLVDSPLGIRFGEQLENPIRVPSNATIRCADEQLDLGSLTAAMGQLEEMSITRACDLLGRNAGKGVYAFLADFVTKRRQELSDSAD